MIIRKLAASAAALALLAAAPATAAATSAQSLSLSGARAGSSLKDDSNIEGMGTGAYIIGAIVIGLAIWGIIELTDNGHHNPSSP